MIQSGGWCNLRAPDEHTKLSRIELNFSPLLDNAFKINVAKMRVQLPISVRDEIDRAIKPAVSLAREYYDNEKKKASKPQINHPSELQAQPINLINHPKIQSVKPQDISFFKKSSDLQLVFTLDEIEKKALELAIPSEKVIISSVFLRLRKLFGDK